MITDPKKLESKIKSSLDASVMSLDKDTRQALAAMRERSLQKQPAHTWLNFKVWIPASGLAMTALLVTLFVYHPNHLDEAPQHFATQQALQHEQPEQIAMLELLTNAEDLETTTDPDFYVWMDEVLATEDANNAV